MNEFRQYVFIYLFIYFFLHIRYSIQHVEKANDMGAIETLMVTDELFRYDVVE